MSNVAEELPLFLPTTQEGDGTEKMEEQSIRPSDSVSSREIWVGATVVLEFIDLWRSRLVI